MTKKFKLIGVESNKVYFESNERPELQRWLDEEYGATGPGLKKNKVIKKMPEAMRISQSAKE